MKEQTASRTLRGNIEKPIEFHNELTKLNEEIKAADKIIDELKEENEELKSSNAHLKTELKQFKEQFLSLMGLLDTVIDDETINIPTTLSPSQFKF